MRSILRRLHGVRLLSSTSAFRQFLAPMLSVGAGNGFVQVCGLLTNIVLLRLLTVEAYGGFAVVNSTIALAALIFSAGFSLATTRTIAAVAGDPIKVSRILNYLYRITAILGGAGGLLVVCLSGPISEKVFGHSELRIPMALSGVLVFANILNGIQIGALQGLQSFHLLNIANLCRGSLQLVFASLGAYIAGLSGTIIAFSVASLVACGINSRQLRNVVRIRGGGCATTQEIRASGFFRIAKSALGSQLTSVPVPWVINLLLLRSANGLQDVARLNVARQLVQAATFVPEVISQISLPRLTSAFTKNASMEFRRTVRISAAIQILFVVVAGAGILSFRHPIGRLFKIDSEITTVLLSLAVLQAILTVLSMPYGAILWATGDGRKAFLFALMRSIASLFTVWIFRDNGSVGVLIAMCIVLTGQFAFIVIPRSYKYFVPARCNSGSQWPSTERPSEV